MPFKFEAGTPIAEALALVLQSILEQIGFENIKRHEEELIAMP